MEHLEGIKEQIYNEIIYESYPYWQTHPENLYVTAKLLGLEELPDFRKCRILELGCAGGGNIIPIALEYPDCEIIGIDYAKTNIDEGNNVIGLLGLENIKLIHISIEDIKKQIGKFDYIIAHGIFSWVSDKTRLKILDVCRNHLNRNGVAYISYNTLPGFSNAQIVRKIMQYCTKDMSSNRMRINKAKNFLKFINKNYRNKNDVYSNALIQEVEFIKSHEDFYVLYEYLGKENKAFYFEEFFNLIQSNSLQYLAESHLSEMHIGNFSDEAIEYLDQYKNDLVRVEQYIDFLTNRRFRMSLICHKDIKVKRDIQPQRLNDLYVHLHMQSDRAFHRDRVNEVAFRTKSGKVIKSTDPEIIDLFATLVKQKMIPIKVSTLIDSIQSLYSHDIRSKLEDNILQIFLIGGMNLSPVPAKYVTHISRTPKMSSWARYLASNRNWVSNQRNEKIIIGDVEKMVAPLLDGENSIEDMTRILKGHVTNSNKYHSPLYYGEEEIERNIRQIVTETVEQFAKNSLLIS